MHAWPSWIGAISMRSSIGIATLLVYLVVGCASVGPPPPTTGYRAAVTLRTTPRGETRPTTTRLFEFYYERKSRREMQIDGEAIVVIDRPDLYVSWILHPDSKTFDEVRIASPQALVSAIPNPFGPRAKATFEDLGLETVDGSEARKFAVAGKAISGHAWLTEEQIPVKFVGTMRSRDRIVDIEMVYSNVRRGRQAAYLFTVPVNFHGYEKRKQGARGSSSSPTPIQVEDMKRRLEEQQQQNSPL